MPKEPATFRAQDAVRVQQEARRLLGLDEEVFSLPSFIGMLSDEIEQLRSAGWTDDRIAEMIRRTTLREVTPGDVTANYAPPEARHAWSGP